jgi:hypothetical protein
MRAGELMTASYACPDSEVVKMPVADLEAIFIGLDGW